MEDCLKKGFNSYRHYKNDTAAVLSDLLGLFHPYRYYKTWMNCNNVRDYPMFHSLGTIKQNFWIERHYTEVSIPYRYYKTTITCISHMQKWGFQFLIGTIKRSVIDGEIIDSFKFQFLIGTIKLSVGWLFFNNWLVSLLIGTIKL